MGSNGPSDEGYNRRSPAVKRILREAKELKDATYDYYACPLEDNIFEWHFTVRGASDTDFAGGHYHGRIILPNEYPMKPPSIILLTPNGRFEVNKKICLSISGYHPETWMPSWSIRTVLLAIISFMPTKAEGAIGSLDYTTTERQLLAKRSLRWACSICGEIKHHLKSTPEPDREPTDRDNLENAALQDFLMNVSFKGEAGKNEPNSNGKVIEEEKKSPSKLETARDDDKSKTDSMTLSSLSSNEQSEESNNSGESSSGSKVQPTLVAPQVTQPNRAHNVVDSSISNLMLCAILAIIVALLLRRFLA